MLDTLVLVPRATLCGRGSGSWLTAVPVAGRHSEQVSVFSAFLALSCDRWVGRGERGPGVLVELGVPLEY